MNNNELMVEKYIDMIQDVFLPCDNNHSLNFTGIANAMKIATSNTKFRKFLNHETKELSNNHIKKIIEYADYDLMIVPVKKETKEHEVILNTIDNNMLDIINELKELKNKFEKLKVVKKDIQELKNQNAIHASLLSDKIHIPKTIINQTAYDKINNSIKNDNMIDTKQQTANDIKNEELFFD